VGVWSENWKVTAALVGLNAVMAPTPAAPGGITIRAGVPADAEALAALHLDVWEDAYADLMPARVFEERRARLPQRIEGWRSLLESGVGAVSVADGPDGLVGFASAGPPQDPADAAAGEELWTLYLRASWWGRRLGHALLVDVLADRPAHLWVLDTNDRAVAFYERHGFARDGAWRRDDLGTELRMARGGRRSV
jgi:GNAT superfamily N-acetyltransferase